jgi:hypothetical protein
MGQFSAPGGIRSSDFHETGATDHGTFNRHSTFAASGLANADTHHDRKQIRFTWLASALCSCDGVPSRCLRHDHATGTCDSQGQSCQHCRLSRGLGRARSGDRRIGDLGKRRVWPLSRLRDLLSRSRARRDLRSLGRMAWGVGQRQSATRGRSRSVPQPPGRQATGWEHPELSGSSGSWAARAGKYRQVAVQASATVPQPFVAGGPSPLFHLFQAVLRPMRLLWRRNVHRAWKRQLESSENWKLPKRGTSGLREKPK